MAQRLATRICRRIAGTDKLNAFQRYPCLIVGTEKALMLDQLAQERDHALCTVRVHVGQIDFVAEQHQPLADLNGSEDDTVRGFAIFTVVVERFQEQLRCGGRREVETDYFHVGQGSQRRKQGHGLAGTGRTTKDCIYKKNR